MALDNPPVSRALTPSAHDPLALEAELGPSRLHPLAQPEEPNESSMTRAERDERLAELVRAQHDNVWRALRRLGVPEAASDDACQEVFIVAARKLPTIERGRERHYLYGIAVRVAANARRAHNARREQLDEHALLSEPSGVPASDALLEEKQARLLFDRVLDAMPEDLRTAFVLFEIEGFALRELSELLEVPVGTVSSRLRRAREAFHQSAQRVKRAWLKSGGSP
jgi:RNA polymerase sigma-70 factor (ECF subfamily)